MKPIRLLHFADAHIDMVNYGRHDLTSQLPMRVMDFLKSLDTIVETAVTEQVDLVIFAGDAYKDRNPQPTFQREWGKRIMKLSQAGIPTILLVGNHDVSPASGRAHTLHEFDTLAVPHVYVGDKIRFFGSEQLGIPVQIITLPWVSRSQLMSKEETAGQSLEELLTELEDRVTSAVNQLIEQADPHLPLILTAHASVQGATFGSERAVMLGHELVLSRSLVQDKRLDYVALGHIHKHQNLATGQPPVIYPGSIERIDFGEAKEKKGFVLATVGKGEADWHFVPLKTRPFIDLKVEPTATETFMSDILAALPDPERLENAVCRLQISYNQEWEPLLDEKAIEAHFQSAFSFSILKHRHTEKRARLGDNASVESLPPEKLLEIYWRTMNIPADEITVLQGLAQEIITNTEI